MERKTLMDESRIPCGKRRASREKNFTGGRQLSVLVTLEIFAGGQGQREQEIVSFSCHESQACRRIVPSCNLSFSYIRTNLLVAFE